VFGPGIARLIDESKAACAANRDSRVRGNDSVGGGSQECGQPKR